MEDDYLNALQLIRFEIFKGNIEVCALVCREQDKYCSIKDGFRVLTHDEISKSLNSESQEDYPDFIVVCNLKVFKETKDYIVSKYSYPRTHILPSSIFFIKCFDFALYANLVVNPVSILCNDCLAGYIYRYLRLPYASPLIWTSIKPKDFLLLCEHPLDYLSNGIAKKNDPDLLLETPLIAELKYQNFSIKVNLRHYKTFEEAQEKFNRRLSRLNRENLFVILDSFEGIDVQDFYQFKQAMLQNKFNYATSLYKSGLDRNIFTQKFPNLVPKSSHPNNYRFYIHNNIFRHVDLLKMLNGLPCFLRETSEL